MPHSNTQPQPCCGCCIQRILPTDSLTQSVSCLVASWAFNAQLARPCAASALADCSRFSLRFDCLCLGRNSVVSLGVIALCLPFDVMFLAGSGLVWSGATVCRPSVAALLPMIVQHAIANCCLSCCCRCQRCCCCSCRCFFHLACDLPQTFAWK